jgi:drug/metabolite transporter (DMT)-like permease
MRTREIALLLLVGAIWGSEWLVTGRLNSAPLGALALRYAIAAILLRLLALASRARRPSPQEMAIGAITGICIAGLPVLLIGWASGRISPGLLVVILAMTPLLAALMEGKASGRLLTALVGGVAGTALLAAQGLSFALTQWAGAAAALLAAVLVAESVLLMKRKLADVAVIPLAAYQLSAAAVIVALWSWFAEGRAGFELDRRLVSTEAVLAVVGGVVAQPLYCRLLREMESFQMTASQWVVTIVGVCEGLLFVREAPGWRMVVGAAILVVSFAALLRVEPGGERPVTLTLTGGLS